MKKPAATQPIDALAELEALFEIQKQRIQIEVTNEKNIKKLLDGTHVEIAEARALLEAIAKLRNDLWK